MTTSYLTNTIFTFTNRVLSVLITFLAMVLIARGLGPSGQGSYSLLNQLSRTFFYFFSFGFPVGMVFYFGRRIDERQKLIKAFLYLYILIAFVSIIFATLFSYLGYEYFFKGIEPIAIVIALAGIPIWFANSYFGAIYQGLQNFRQLNINSISQPLTLGVCVSILFLIDQISILNVIFSYILSLIINLVLNIYFLKKDKFKLGILKSEFDSSVIKDSFQYSFKSYLGSISEFLIYRVDIYIIAYFLPKASLGLYVIAVNLAERLWIFSEAISKVLFAKIVNTKDEEKKNYFTIYTLQGAFLVGIVGSAALYLVGELFIRFFFGDAFSISSFYLFILIPGVLFQSLGVLMKKILESRGYPGTNAKSSILCLVVNIILNFALIPHYEVTGAAISTSISYTIYFLIQSSALRVKFGIKKRDYLITTPSKIKKLFNEIKRKK